MEFKQDKRKRKAFGTFLKQKRKQNGYTVRRVAEIISVPFGVYASIERGEKAKITMSMLSGLSAIYDTDYDALCFMCERVPVDVFYKILRCPNLLEVIRSYEV